MSSIKELPKSFTLSDEYFEKRLYMSKRDIEEIQNCLLRQTYLSAWDNVPFYRKRFQEHGLSRDSIMGIDDLSKLPFTTSNDIRPDRSKGNTSFNHLAVPTHDISLIHTSAGTTGFPKVFAYTGSDIINWASNVATCYWINGFRKGDIVIGPNPFGEYTGGGGLYLGLTMLGVTYIPMSVGPGVSEKVVAHITGKWQLGEKEVLLDPLLVANGFICLASFIARLEEIMDKQGIDSLSCRLQKGAFGSEPWSDALRERIEKKFGIDARDMYGLGEFFGPGVAAECKEKSGLHVLSDVFFAEVVDPETGQNVDIGQSGELVLTGLNKEAMPFLRYRTGDRTSCIEGSCSCGINHQKIGRITGRIDTDDIIIPGGIVVNRLSLEEIILSEKGLANEYAIAIGPHQEKAITKLYIIAEGNVNDEERISQSIKRKIRVEYGHTPIVSIVSQGTIPRGPGKAKRFFSFQELNKIVVLSSEYKWR